MANPAEPYAATLVSAGLRADGLSQLKAASDAVGATIVNRVDARAADRDTTAGLTAKASQERAVVKVLDALVKSHIAATSRRSHNRTRRRSQAARPRE